MTQHIYNQLDATAETTITTDDYDLATMLLLASWEVRMVKTPDGGCEYECERDIADARAAQTRLAHEMAVRMEDGA